MGSKPNGRPLHWPELDRLRFLAAALMVTNHLAVESPAVLTSGAVSAAAFVGSFAPVLFFFVTGLGYGVQSAARSTPRGHGYLVKVAILLAADFDFFTFIGLSMLLLEWVRRVPRSGLLAAALAAAVVASRFVAVPWLLRAGWWGPWWGYLLGIEVPSAIIYKFSPWLAFPLLGYTLGRLAASRPDAIKGRGQRTAYELLALAMPLLAATLALAARGSVFFRYGSISLAYFVASLTMLLVSLACARWLAERREPAALVAATSLSGLRSFAVVPLHYALIALYQVVPGPADGLVAFVVELLAVLLLSLAGSSLVESAAGVVSSPTLRRPAWIVLGGFVLGYHLMWKGQAGEPALLILRTAVELSLCVLLASFRSPARSRPDARHVVGLAGVCRDGV